jgi:hypothetical protein
VPPGLLEDEDVPPGALLDDAPPPGLDDIAPEPEDPLLDVPPMPLGEEVELEVDPLGLLGALEVVEDDDDEPPGTTTVSFSLVVVVVLLEGAEPPGITVVVSFFSQALSASAAAITINNPLRFMSTPFSFCGYKVHPRVSKSCAANPTFSGCPLRQCHPRCSRHDPCLYPGECADRARR